jgi:hypothetical protein
MDSVLTTFFIGLVLALYTLLIFTRQTYIWIALALLFVVASAFLRWSVEVEGVRDFAPYFKSYMTVRYGTIPQELWFEPYRLILLQTVLLYETPDILGQITAVYYIHFAIVTAFFLWLAYQKEVSFEAKLVLFLAFYPTIAFVWLRAGMGYVAACFLMSVFAYGRWRGLQFMLPLFHASTFPILLVNKVKNLKTIQRTGIVLVAAAAVFLAVGTSYADYITYKVERYSDTSDSRSSVNLLLFHIANIFVFLYLAAINKKFRTNFSVLVLMAIYMGVYFVNPVMGLRMFPFVLIATIVERISFTRFKFLTLVVCAGYVPIYLARFDQVFL